MRICMLGNSPLSPFLLFRVSKGGRGESAKIKPPLVKAPTEQGRKCQASKVESLICGVTMKKPKSDKDVVAKVTTLVSKLIPPPP